MVHKYIHQVSDSPHNPEEMALHMPNKGTLCSNLIVQRITFLQNISSISNQTLNCFHSSYCKLVWLLHSSSSMILFSRDKSQRYASALSLQLQLPSWKEEMSAMQKAKEEPGQLVLLVPDSLAWATVYFPVKKKAGRNAWQCAPSSIRERN